SNLKRVIDQPDFLLDAIERLRNQMLVGIRQKQQSPAQLASEAFFAALYGDHPYAYPSEGTEESLQGLTREKIISFHKQYYVAANAIVAMVGDISRQQAQKLVDDLMADIPAGKKATALPDVPALTEAKQVHVEHPSTQTHVLIGQLGIKRGDSDYFPLYVGNHVLGGG
ncbi:MAG: insulinase family protein, partial [Gammaproteobacteria bacterium]|nr:insulinase family protein [Gammaproteobacteria bacterium]